VAKWRACLVTLENFEYETRVRWVDGEYRWMLHRKAPLRDGRGNSFDVKNLADNPRADDRTHGVTIVIRRSLL
jgi:hypothetical protein